jgi:hypothetical protein
VAEGAPLTIAVRLVRSGFAARAGLRVGATDSPDTVAKGLPDPLGRRSLVRPACCRDCWNSRSPSCRDAAGCE